MRRAGVCLYALHFEDVSPAQYQWYSPEDSETAVDKPPNDGQASNLTRYESQRNDSSAGNQAKRDDPLVAYRIPVRSDEQNGEHKVGKGQPVRSICEEWILRICIG